MSLSRKDFKSAGIVPLVKNERQALVEGTQIPYHKLDKNLNRIRLMPLHPKDDVWFQYKKVTWFNSNSSLNKVPYYNFKIHYGCGEDFLDTYIALAREKARLLKPDEKERNAVLSVFFGHRTPDGMWHPGLAYNEKFVVYAVKGDMLPQNLGKLELYKNDIIAINNLAAINGVQNMGELQDPDDGVYLNFILDPKNLPPRYIKKEEFSMFGLSNAERTTKFAEWARQQQITDEVLALLASLPGLTEKPVPKVKESVFQEMVEHIILKDMHLGFNLFTTHKSMFENIIAENREACYKKPDEKEDYLTNRPKESIPETATYIAGEETTTVVSGNIPVHVPEQPAEFGDPNFDYGLNRENEAPPSISETEDDLPW